MMRLKLVNTMEEQEAHICTGDGGLLDRAVVLKVLLLPWPRTDRIVCADLYFALVGALQELNRIGLRFFRSCEDCNWAIPQSDLSHLEITDRGNRRAFIAKDENGTPSMLAFYWVDCYWHYFITSASSLQPGRASSQSRWQQVREVQRVNLKIPKLEVPSSTMLHTG
jgi:hypothetical protein